MGARMIIRRAEPTDLSAVQACVEASLNATYGGLWTDQPLTVDAAGWDKAWLALDRDGLVGVGLAEGDRVSDLWVVPAAQGLGAGRALLAALEAEIAARGFAAWSPICARGPSTPPRAGARPGSIRTRPCP